MKMNDQALAQSLNRLLEYLGMEEAEEMRGMPDDPGDQEQGTYGDDMNRPVPGPHSTEDMCPVCQEPDPEHVHNHNTSRQEP